MIKQNVVTKVQLVSVMARRGDYSWDIWTEVGLREDAHPDKTLTPRV